jgi:hypothetical protein
MEREESVRQELSELETRFQEDIRRIETSFSPEMLSLDQISIRPKSAGIILKAFGLGWLPFRREEKGERMQDRI